MAGEQILSLPAAAAGKTPASNASAWVFGSWSAFVGGTTNNIQIIGLQFQWQTSPAAADTTYEALFDIGVGTAGNEVTQLQFPVSYRADTITSANNGLGYWYSSGVGGSPITLYLPEMFPVNAGATLSVRVACSIASAITFTGVKLLYKDIATTTPEADQATDTAPAPTASATVAETPAADQAKDTASAPAVTGAIAETPAADADTANAPVPTTSALETANITPPSAAVQAAAPAPSAVAVTATSPAADAVPDTAPTPDVTAGIAITTDAAADQTTALLPDVSSAVAVAPVADNIIETAPAPSVAAQTATVPPAAQITTDAPFPYTTSGITEAVSADPDANEGLADAPIPQVSASVATHALGSPIIHDIVAYT